MEDTKSFKPLYSPSSGTAQGTLAATVTVAGTTTAAPSAVFPGTFTQNEFVTMYVCNQGTVWAYVNFGTFGNVAAATVNSLPIAPGTCRCITVDGEVSGASVIYAATGSGNVSFTRGMGV